MPPFAGPSVMLYCTRKPVKTTISPLSICTGHETMICRLGWVRMRQMPGSRLRIFAASSNSVSIAPKRELSGPPIAAMATIIISKTDDQAAGRSGSFSLHARHPRERLRGQAVDDAPVRGLRHARRDERALQGAARGGRDGPERRLRSADADGPRSGS